MKREIITIDEQLCNGCGECIPGCPEGALQMIDGKARLVSDLFCDGLGACIGRCPQEAISIETREAEDYDEKRVMEERIIPKGRGTIIAHLKHLKEHGADDYYQEAVKVLQSSAVEDIAGILEEVSEKPQQTAKPFGGGCPGTLARRTAPPRKQSGAEEIPSALTHWPIQMHLIHPDAPVYRNSDVLIAADCTAFSLGTFHRDLLSGKALAIACPKLDTGIEVYREKITRLVDEARIQSLTVAVMEVPCCAGLVKLVRQGVHLADRKVPIKVLQLSIEGEVLRDE